jgi:hypothetical protein
MGKPAGAVNHATIEMSYSTFFWVQLPFSLAGALALLFVVIVL